MSLNEFTEIYINLSDELKNLIEEILETVQTQAVCPGVISHTSHTVQSPF